MKLSLPAKTIGIAFIPFITVLGTFLALNHNYQDLWHSYQTNHSRIEVIENISDLLHQLQQERNTSILLNLELSRAQELAEYIQKVDDAVRKLKLTRHQVSLPTAGFEAVEQSLNSLQATRLLARRKASAPELFQSYNKISESLLDYQNAFIHMEVSPIQNELFDIVLLQTAKEKASRLSVNMSWVLQLKKPIEDPLVSSLIDLMGSLKAFFRSPFNHGRNSTLESSLSWQRLDQAFRSIIKYSASGKYTEEAPAVAIAQLKISTEIKNLIDSQLQQSRQTLIHLQDQTRLSLGLIRVSFLIILLPLAYLIWFASRRIIRPVLQIVTPLEESTHLVESSTQELQEASIQISQQSTEAALTLQSIASSVEKLSEQMQAPPYDSGTLRQTSNLTHVSANQGKATAQELTLALQRISTNQESLLAEVQEKLQFFSEISQTVREVSKKAKSINEIAFQTKLLSINASVEAARAGESGRGFSIVAEEINTLSQVTSNAVKEITRDLDESVRKVDSFLAEAQSKIQEKAALGKDKIQIGISSSKQCGELLDEVLKNIDLLNVHANEIISKNMNTHLENSQNLNDIAIAIKNLDQLTHDNSRSAVALTITIHKFFAQIKVLHEHVELLNQTLHKEKTHPTKEATPAPSAEDRQAS